MSVLLFVLAAPYILLLFVCMASFNVKDADREGGGSPSAITFVVCTHNENLQLLESTLLSVLHSMRNDDRLIVVCDYRLSADVDKLHCWAARTDNRIRILENSRNKGKKAAQRCGVEAATTDVVTCVDADCLVGKSFSDGIRCSMPKNDNPFLLLLPIHMIGDHNLCGMMMEQEFVCLQMVTAGTAMCGHPVMANGAGMVFRRSLYLEHDSQEQYVSGDDMFLLQYASTRHHQVLFSADRRCLVSTSTPASVADYLRQRVRWLGKAGGYKSLGVRIVAISVLAANVSWPVALVAAFVGVVPPYLPICLFIVKLFMELSLLYAARQLWQWQKSLTATICLALVYPIMIGIVALRAWKSDKGKW